MDITTVIKEMVATWGESARSINDGDCERFAQEVEKLIPDAKPVWDWFDLSKGYNGLHCFIRYKDRFYDSESPEGVEDWADLPFFKRNEPNCTKNWWAK